MNFRFFKIGLGALALAGLFFLNACGDAQTVTPEATLTAETAAPTRAVIALPTPAPGWSVVRRARFQISLPDTWQPFQLQENDLKKAIAAAQNSNPPLAEQLRAMLESGQYKSFLLYATDQASAPVVRNVSVTPVSPGKMNDLQAFAKAYADALPNVIRGAKVGEIQAPLKINGMNAAGFVYDVSLVDNAGKLTTLRGVQYLYVPDSGDAFMITVTGDAADAEKFMPLARQIAASFVAVTP